VTELSFDQFIEEAGPIRPDIISFPRYTKPEMKDILMLRYPIEKQRLLDMVTKRRTENTEDTVSDSEMDEEIQNVQEVITESLFGSFVDLVQDIFKNPVKDLKEHQYAVSLLFPKYVEPVLAGRGAFFS
jgi:hypothetical protein